MVQQIHDGDGTGVSLGQAAASLVSFHGATPVDQAAAITLATNATIGTIRTSVISILAALREKGFIAT